MALAGGYTDAKTSMDRYGNAEPSGARLARSYLSARAEQGAEQQPKQPAPADMQGTVVLPRLDRVHLNSPEAHAQYRLALLARLSSGGDAWFTLAQRGDDRRTPRRGRRR